MLLLPRAPYPLPSRVAVDAMHQSARNADYQHLQEPDLLSLGARGYLTGGYMLNTLWFFKQFVHTFPRGDMLITF